MSANRAGALGTVHGARRIPDFDDDGFKGGLGGVLGQKFGHCSVTLGADMQGRYNPKSKVTNFYDSDGVFADERELESDTRDGTDYSFNATAAGLGRPFLAAPDAAGQRHPFVVHWASENDVSGGIVARGIGAGAELLQGTVDSSAIYWVIHMGLFGD